MTEDEALQHALATRRSVRATMLREPGPDAATLDAILTVAARVPDHKKLAPWRFIVFEGEGRQRAGCVFADAVLAEAGSSDTPSEIRLQTERERFLRAPVVVAVVASFVDKPGVPEWEQTLSAGASAFAMTLAAKAHGFASCWITEWMTYSSAVGQAFGLGANEKIAGFIYIGTPTETQDDRDRPALAEKVSRF